MVMPAAPVGANSYPGLVGLWHFDGDADDSTVNANDGTITGASWTTSGMFGKALSFDGTDDYVLVLDDDTLSPGSTVTLEAWIKPAALSGIRMVAGKWNDSLREYEIQLWSGKVRFYAYSSVPGYIYAESSTTLTVDTWYHVAGVWDGSNLQVYINGSPDGSSTAFAPTAGIPNTNARFTIGAQYWASLGGWQRFFQGTIDEVRIWNGALGSTAIQQSYELGGSQTSPSVVKLKHKVLTSGEVVCFTSAFLLGIQSPGATKTVDIYIMSSSGDRTIDDVGLRRVTPGNTNGNLLSASGAGTHWTAEVTNGTGSWKGKTSTSIHLYAELDTYELLGVNAQYLP